ncbi:MAG TPA: hypothetical protein DCY55_07770 [Gammaproteobacteria bacterium]|nr:hypothetical protein [Gammaproteobacteria bacterium]
MVYAADTGAVLHEIQTGSSILAAPLSYTVDGEQYIAVMAGYGGGPFAYYPVGSAVEKYGNEGRLIAFKLGGVSVPLPVEVPKLGPIPEPPIISSASGETLERGKAIFEKACGECHWNTNGGYPDLRRMTASVHSIFNEIVLDGVYEPLGMAGFSDILSLDQMDDIYQYLLKISHEAYLEDHAQASAG